MQTNDKLRDAWASLGVAFHHSTSVKSDPESALLALVQSSEFPDDKKMLSLALLWLTHYAKLVHVERFKVLSKTLSPYQLAILGAIASKCVKLGDHRWHAVVKLAKQGTQGQQFQLGDSETFIQMRGLDPEFSEFGIRIAPIFPENAKKLLPRREILRRNEWLKFRVLFGTNMRADVAAVIFLKLTPTAYGAAKMLGCSPNTAYRNWKDLHEAGFQGLS
jgi:hypothetical protein